ncbi:MAG: M48 family metallopeptidase [Colwellia sp.]
MIEYKTIKSRKRKTISLQIKHGLVTVRAPYFVSAAFIEAFIAEKTVWIQKKVKEQQIVGRENCNFLDGSIILFLGTEHTLSIIKDKTSSVHRNSKTNQLIITLSHRIYKNILKESEHNAATENTLIAKQVKKQLAVFFNKQMNAYLNEHLSSIAEYTSLYPKSFHVRLYKSRWGSCNNKKELQFNYLLMMAPLWVINYVIIHELCHLKFMNHSADFWQLVAQFSPDYRLAKQWFKDNQAKLYWHE